MLILLESKDVLLDEIKLVADSNDRWQYNLVMSFGLYSITKQLTKREVIEVSKLLNIGSFKKLININLLEAPIECSISFNGTVPISIFSKKDHLFIDFSTSGFDDHTLLEFCELVKQNKTSALH